MLFAIYNQGWIAFTYNLQADCISLLYLSGFTMYSALKVAMASDQTNNLTAIWKNVHASHGRGKSEKILSDNQDITVEDIEETVGDSNVSEQDPAGKLMKLLPQYTFDGGQIQLFLIYLQKGYIRYNTAKILSFCRNL